MLSALVGQWDRYRPAWCIRIPQLNRATRRHLSSAIRVMSPLFSQGPYIRTLFEFKPEEYPR